LPESDSYVDHFTELASEGIGFLTWDQFDRFRRAMENSRKYIPWLRVAGYITSGSDPDEFRVSGGHRTDIPLGLPATWLAAEEIASLLEEVGKWATHEDVATFGHEFALQLTSEVETAVARWPLSDRTHKVKFFRCMSCDQATLKFYPPTIHGSVIRDTAIKCTDKACRAVMDEIMFARMAVLIEAEQEEIRERAKRLAAGKRSAGKGESEPGDGVPVDLSGEGADDAPRPDAVGESAGSAQGGAGNRDTPVYVT
jgi:hypothetical protein